MKEANTEQEALYITGTNAKNLNENKENLHWEMIEGTPFQSVNKEGKHFLTFGEYRISEIFNSQQELNNWWENNQWNITLRLIATCIEINEKMQKDKRTSQEDKIN